jgi:hypothetical protein
LEVDIYSEYLSEKKTHRLDNQKKRTSDLFIFIDDDRCVSVRHVSST